MTLKVQCLLLSLYYFRLKFRHTSCFNISKHQGGEGVLLEDGLYFFDVSLRGLVVREWRKGTIIKGGF